MNRHTKHTPYCQRRDRKTGEVKCRFGFPQQCHAINKPHLYCERVKGGIRWKMYLPINDPTLNTINEWQVAAQRSNTDFTPLIDHHSALEYSCKYATKAEKGSDSMGKLMTNALNKLDAREAEGKLDDAGSASTVFGSFLTQQTGGRDWSAQEVAHVNMGLRTVWGSHEVCAPSQRTARSIHLACAACPWSALGLPAACCLAGFTVAPAWLLHHSLTT